MSVTSGVGDTVRLQFPVYDIDGITPLLGLINTDFVKILINETAISAVPVTVTEIGSGYYYVEFVPNAEGMWLVGAMTPADDLFTSLVQVGEYNPAEALAIIKKAAINRLEVNLTTQELILYDDDGVTEFQKWDLQTDEGPPLDPVTTQPGVQTKRKVPKL